MARQSPASAVASASNTSVINAGVRLSRTGIQTWPFVPSVAPYLGGQANMFADGIVAGLTPRIPRIQCSTCHQHRNDPAAVTPAVVAPTGTEQDHLADYLALSTVSHCLDGWRYLSLAADAATRGARNEVIHLAYYAELRAALGILASDGIAIMNNEDHFALDASGGVIPIHKRATHSIAWEALQEWAKRVGQGQRLLANFSCFGASGSEWLDAMRGSADADVIVSQWFSDWAMDLRNWGGDQSLRNEVSYRPNLRVSAFDPLAEDEMALITACVHTSLRGGFHAFEELDVAVTRKLAKAVADSNHIHRSADQATVIGLKDLQRQNGWSREDVLERFRILRGSQSGMASQILTMADPTNSAATGVFSRAFLMMRLSSGLLRQYWRQVAPVSPSDYDWIKSSLHEYGKHCSLWDPARSAPAWDFLSSDFEPHLEDHKSWIDRNRPFNAFRYISDMSDAVYHLCRFERIPLIACPP